jgi:hypothetical protein
VINFRLVARQVRSSLISPRVTQVIGVFIVRLCVMTISPLQHTELISDPSRVPFQWHNLPSAWRILALLGDLEISMTEGAIG